MPTSHCYEAKRCKTRCNSVGKRYNRALRSSASRMFSFVVDMDSPLPSSRNFYRLPTFVDVSQDSLLTLARRRPLNFARSNILQRP
ncbi:hypothetical protein WN51_04197 [Melipona quadrifasciata]|uniref:Uncharacterized protein n=1 Tax=Melipona quadrifasciata TaxID=166423 RepID=A0A0N0U4C9_9HYME|nr:hypothetical protein WN51_04197 [Melipona quadrifasciata]